MSSAFIGRSKTKKKKKKIKPVEDSEIIHLNLFVLAQSLTHISSESNCIEWVHLCVAAAQLLIK